jgi:cytochrome c biogenesis protein CcmG, thiol:disulfide interchange protein DsbE
MSDPKRFFLVGLLMVIGMAPFAAAQVASPAPVSAPAAQAAPPPPAEVAPAAPAQDPGVELAALVARIAEKFAAAKQYVFEGNLNVSRKSGEGRMDSLAKAKVKLAVMPDDKYVLQVDNVDKTGYVAVSDGQTSWVYVPALKKYTRQESVAVRTRYDSKENIEDPQQYPAADIINEFSRRVLPILAGLSDSPTDVFKNGGARVKYEGQEYAWPVLTVLSKKAEQVSQKLVYLTMDPATLAIAKIVWTTPVSSTGEKVLVRMDFDFDSLHIGQPTADSEFAFSPPPGAKQADFLPAAGQSGASLLNKPAPDFELTGLDGHSIHLGDLKGHPVLLHFWTSWCGPCKLQFPDVAKFSDEYKDKGLVVLGINGEGKEAAARYAKDSNFRFNSLDDSAEKARRLYRVQSLPTVVLINRKGIVVRYFSGVRDERALRAALKSAGL